MEEGRNREHKNCEKSEIKERSRELGAKTLDFFFVIFLFKPK